MNKDKQWRDLTDDELREYHGFWTNAVETAAGWPSAYFAAKQLEVACAEATRRGIDLPNKFPVVIGETL